MTNISMEKISAACAMVWSIELEKDLRSREPGQSSRSIQKIGRRLKRWKNEPRPTLVVSTMFGLVPGEDGLYVDTIILRLVDAFTSGDKETRICVVKIFLSELKHENKGSSRDSGNGMLSKMSVRSQSELLKRVREAYGGGDVESKALALVVFGCCADIAKDVTEVRYIVLSSLLSSHIMEVKASLFAAAALSEYSADFATVFLEMLMNIMTSPETSQSVRLAGAQIFMKLGCCATLANKSYKVGKELILRSSEEDFLRTMLISLSKLASKLLALIPEQVDLLALFLKQKTSIRLRTTVLRCIHYMLERRPYLVSINIYSSEHLFNWFGEPGVPSSLRCEALHMLIKIFSSVQPDKILLNAHECDKLSLILKSAAGSPFPPERLLALRVLVNVCIKCRERAGLHPAGISRLIVDRITNLLESVSDDTWSSEIEQELGDLLRLHFSLMEFSPEFGDLVLMHTRLVIKEVVEKLAPSVETGLPTLGAHNSVNVEINTSSSVLHKFILKVHKGLVACLGRLDECGATSVNVLDELKPLVCLVCNCISFDFSVWTMYALLLHPCTTWHAPTPCENSGTEHQAGRSPCNLVVDEDLLCKFAECMLVADDNWAPYTAGIHAASRGVWVVASLIFQRLTTRVKSDMFHCWLQALSQFSESERNIQAFFLKSSSNSGNSLSWDAIGNDCTVKLVGAVDGFHSSFKIISSDVMLNQGFYFQYLFISLRTRVVGIIVMLTTSLVAIGEVVGSISSNDAARLHKMNKLVSDLVELSSRLRSLAQEYNLLISSWIGMDKKSLNVISSFALGCSLLAFCITFVYINPSSAEWKNFDGCFLKDSGNCIHISLVQDLVAQLWHIDSETCMKLFSLLKADRLHANCFLSQPACQKFVSKYGCIFKLCKSAVEGIIGLQERYQNLSFFQVCEEGAKFVLEMLKGWMTVPFQLPKYFFSSRKRMGSVLFLSIGDSYKLSISQGTPLSLNLCLQMMNIPSHLASKFTNLYCILYCETSSFINQLDRNPILPTSQDTDIMINMHERLQRHVTEQNAEPARCYGKFGGNSVEIFTSFEMNGRKQGFSSCLLDVSSFPVGSYKIHWQCCGIDSDGRYCTFLPLADQPVFTVN